MLLSKRDLSLNLSLKGRIAHPDREDGVRVVTAHELAVLEKEPVWSLSLAIGCTVGVIQGQGLPDRVSSGGDGEHIRVWAREVTCSRQMRF